MSRETLAEGEEGALHLGPERARVYSDLSLEDKERVNRTEVKGTIQGKQVQLADECDTFHSDVDEAPTAQTMFMANLSSADPVYDKAGLPYDSDILSERKVAISYKNSLCLTCANQVQPTLYNGLDIIKTHHVPAIIHNSEDTLKKAKITRKNMNNKMKTPLCTEQNINIQPPDYSKENYLATFSPQTQLTPEQIFWYKDVLKIKAKDLKEQTKPSKPIKALPVYPPNTPATLSPGNNREVHLDYLKHLKESVATLHEIVKEARVERALDRSHASACLYTKHSQDLLEYVVGTCPKDFNKQDKEQATTPFNRKNQVTFEDQCETSNNNTQKHVEQLNIQNTNVPVIPFTGVNSCTDASGSKPRSNTKKNRISPAKSVNKNKVEEHPRTNSGCSKHMTGNRLRLKNFIKKFIRTVRFRNDHFRAIMGYGDYVIGDIVISRVPVILVGTPSSTIIDQDAPSPSHSPSSFELKPPISHQGVAAGSTIIEDNPSAHADNDPFMENVIKNSGCAKNQKVKFAASSFVSKALTWWNTQVQARGHKATIGMSWTNFKALIVEEFCPSNEMEKLETEFWNHKMGVEQTYPPTTAEEKLARKNELKARGTLLMALPNEHQLKFKSYKNSKSLMEAIDKSSSSTNQARGCNSASTNSLSDVMIYSFFANQSNSLQLNNEDLQQIDVDDLEEINLEWQMAMLTMRAKRFLKKTRRAPNATVETTDANALVAQDGFGYDGSDKAEEGPTNFTLIAYTSLGSLSSSSSDSKTVVYKKNEDIFEENIKILKLDIHLRDNALTELRKKLEKAEKERDEIKITLEKFENSFKTLNKMLDSQVKDKYKTSVGYHTVPLLYTGNFMPPKPDLILADVDEYVISESVTSMPAVATNKAKTSKSKPKSVSGPLIKDWISDSEDENETKSKSKQRKPSFAKVDATKASAYWVWRPKHKVLDHVSRNNGASITLKKFDYVDAQGRSKHITGNVSYLSEYEEIDGGYDAFRGYPKGGKITGKGKIIIDTKCVVLSPNFKLLDESQVLLRVPRKNNVYSVDLKNVAPSRGLTCLFAKATLDESNLWHRRLGKESNIKLLVRPILEWTNLAFDIDTLTKSMNYKLVVAGNQSNGSA
nr:reverse transcriptase domain-containing protein [Tanacetum cinerariifolium]